jgi:hypothetical protein
VFTETGVRAVEELGDRHRKSEILVHPSNPIVMQYLARPHQGTFDELSLALLFNNAKLPKESCKKRNCLYRQIVMTVKYNKYMLLLLWKHLNFKTFKKN